VLTAPTAYDVRAHNVAADSDNRIHDDSVARQFGFTGALVPGVDVFAYATHPLVEAFGLDFLRQGELLVRFRRPVYDGDEVRATAIARGDGAYAVAVSGADGEVRCVGLARPSYDVAPTVDGLAPTPLPAAKQRSDGGALPLGALGSVRQEVDAPGHDDYLDAIAETLSLYRAGVVHPGVLLRLANDLLMENVALGPWIHTASHCRFLGVAELPTTLVAHGVVTECFSRNGNDYVRYDALVLADETPVVAVDHTAIYHLATG
jgi:hypothetical protein